MQLGEPDASGRRRPEPAPGTEFTIPCDRVLLAIGQGPELDWIEQPGNEGPEKTKQWRLKADAVTFETGRPGVFGTGDVRIGAATVVQAIAEGRRAAYAVDAYLKGLDLTAIRTRQTLAEPQPEFLSIVPFTSEVKEPRYRMTRAWRPRSATTATSSTSCRTPARRPSPSRPAACSAPARRSASATCAAWASSTARRSRRSSRSTTRAPAIGASPRTASPALNHDYIRDDSHAFILREPSRCIDCGRCAQVCAEVVGAACYDFMRIGFDTLVTTPLDMSLNDTPCVSCGRCAETCPTGALMPKPRVLEKYEVDESRCILCGICVDACPYDALRDGADIELAHTGRERPDDRPDGHRRRRPRDRGHLHPPRARLGRRGPRPRAGSWTRPGCCRCCRRPSAGVPSNGNGHGHGHGQRGHDHGSAVAAIARRTSSRDVAATRARSSSRWPSSGSSRASPRSCSCSSARTGTTRSSGSSPRSCSAPACWS